MKLNIIKIVILVRSWFKPRKRTKINWFSNEKSFEFCLAQLAVMIYYFQKL